MPKRRANGEGTIQHRSDGRWLVKFPTGIKKNGKPEYIYKYGKTQAEALKTLQELQKQKNLGVKSKKAQVTTGDFVNNWIEKVKKPKLATSTLTSYRNSYLNHINPAIGHIPLNRLETAHIQQMLDGIHGKQSTFIKNYNVIHGACEYAVEVLKILPHNPCKGVTFPPDDVEKPRALTKEEQKNYIKALEGEHYRVMFITYLYTGMRLGEAIPLLWSDIDLDKRTISINKKAVALVDQYEGTAKQVVQDYLKTKSSRRTIVITKKLVDILRDYKEKCKEEAERLGEVWSEDGLVFLNSRRRIVQASNLDEINAKIYKRAGIVGATNHSLRHTYATRCYEAGVDIKALSEQLGHKNVKTTYNVYIHLFNEVKSKEIDKLADIDKYLDE